MICSIDGCDRRAEYVTLQLCRSHYDRRRINGVADRPLQKMRGWSLEDKLEAFIDKSGGPDACHRSSQVSAITGYSTFAHNGKVFQTHRVVYERECGSIPEGWWIDHECHNNDPMCPGGPTCLHRACANVRHLVPKTPVENYHAAYAQSELRRQARATRTRKPKN